MPETGVKKIKFAGGTTYMTGNNSLIVVPAQEKTKFEVAEWYPGTPQAQKNNVTWLLKDVKRNNVILKFNGIAGVLININKKYSGQAVFLLEASSSANAANIHHSGILIRGYCKPLIASSQWRTTRDGDNIKNGDPISYGDPVFLHLETEGLNGSTLSVELYNQQLGDDKKVYTYNNVLCINGEVNLLIRNTFAWRGKIDWLQPIENFYIKVKLGNAYIKDSRNQDLHAVYLKVQNKVSNKKIEPPLNLSPVKLGKQEVNDKRYELCRYTAITITEDSRTLKVFSEKPPVPAKLKDFEIVAGEAHNIKKISVALEDYHTEKCLVKNSTHKKNVAKVTKDDKPQPDLTIKGGKVELQLMADISNAINVNPFMYIWPPMIKPQVYQLSLDSCRYTRKLNFLVYPDIKWELEFKWNHDAPFAFKYSNKLNQYELKEAREKAIGSAVDAGMADAWGEMAQSFELSLKAKWDKEKQSVEYGKKICEKIGKTLATFVKIKQLVADITTEVSNRTPFSLTIKSPAIAASIGWYRDEQTDGDVSKAATIVELKFGADPLIGAEFKIDLIQAGAEFISPAIGRIITWLREHSKKHLDLEFSLTLSGDIKISGETQINVNEPKLTQGKVSALGVITVDLLLKAHAKGEFTAIGIQGAAEGEASAKASTGVTGGVDVGADQKGIYILPRAEFAGVIVTIVLKGSIKYGVMKKTFDKSPDPLTVLKPASVKFNKDNFYINH
ncbi:hypothetical protein [Mucilaginibacter sp. KACC 22063]|uniref:hypothetical protein n=1 Tax=Mucilaginibacter sp. KACC 22063 TaxID=3025666 RepID=UPI002366A2BC|nr:hypothetical protein [Mucilaginibacter sp. KACC 22063]WDF54411.1 hypothetical protein PQ461_15820 [Mucilaginibacter sp. KACC 22063]